MASTRKPEIPESFPGQVSAEEVEKNKELEKSLIFSHDDLASIDSYEDALRLSIREFGGVINAHEDKNLGTGFRIATDEDKIRLIGVPLLLLDWRFNPGDFGEDYVSIHVIAQMEHGVSKYVINDGGTGIYRDLRMYTQKTNRMGALQVRRGLRVSEYNTIADKNHPDNGKPAPKDYKGPTGKGKTFYLDFSG